MDSLEDIRQILDLLGEYELSEIEVERDGLKIRVKKEARGPAGGQPPAPVASAPVPPAPVPASPEPVPDDAVDLTVVTSPIVGTFYRAPEPGAPPFVDTGDHVRKGQVLCIIEAMKLMNEIESEIAGTIKEVLVENAQPVQYDQPLFVVDKD